jgi:hypothetical protein
MLRFIEYYSDFFSSTADDINYPKVPSVALLALYEYIKVYKEDMDRFKILYTETGGAVPISDKDVIHFRLDSIMHDSKFDMICSLEHKTGSRKAQTWLDKWQTSFQVGTYTHVLYCTYNPKDVWGVRINGTFFYKRAVGPDWFERVPCKKDPAWMEGWLHTANYHVNEIKRNIEMLAECTPDDPAMWAFPMRSSSCSNYYGCKYLPFCTAWSNPLRKCEKPPIGFKVEFWDPRRRAEEAHVKLTFEGR